MAVESVGGDPSNSDFTSALKGARDKWHNAVEDALEDWVSKNMDKFDLEARPFSQIRGEADADDIVEVLLSHRGGAGYLYFMEMEGHGVGTWDGDWDQLFVDGGNTVDDLSKYMENKVSRPYQNLKNEIDEIAFASVPEDEDGYEDDSYAHNRYATRGALIRLASSLPKGSEERKVILASVQKRAYKSFKSRDEAFVAAVELADRRKTTVVLRKNYDGWSISTPLKRELASERGERVEPGTPLSSKQLKIKKKMGKRGGSNG